MVTLLSKSIHRSTFARVVVLGLMALCGAASPLLGQETVAGKFTLTENTSLGKKFLPAGAYTFSIEPVGILQSVSSIQGARQVVQVVVLVLGHVLGQQAPRHGPALDERLVHGEHVGPPLRFVSHQ